MNSRDLVAWNMRRLRVAKGLSQERLAHDAGVDRTYVSRLERKVENPSIGVLEKIAAALQVHISELLVEPGPDDMAPKPLKAGRRTSS
jgi:transcriptional regulator with XRE-family HTH domain